jgi:protein TonB
MLAYAAGRPRTGERRSSPNTMLLIISAHIAAVAMIMSAKMDLPRKMFDPPTKIISVPITPPPPPIETLTPPKSHAIVTNSTTRVEAPRTAATVTTTDEQPPVDIGTAPDSVPATGSVGTQTLPPLPQPVPTSTPAQPMTAASDLRPPYPESKLLAGEEASLTLRLTIDENGRVVGVAPIGRADPVFLAAARRHLMARWHYKPAMQDGRAVSSTLVVTLRFQLDD